MNLSRNLFSLFWDISIRWRNWLGIRIATGGNQTKVQDFCCCKIRHSWRAHNAIYVAIDWICQIISPQILGCGLVKIDRYAWHCVRQGLRIVSKCKQIGCIFVWFPVSVLISIQFQRVMSRSKWKKTNFSSNL